MIPWSDFLARVESLKDRVARACTASGRGAGSVRVLPVTKGHGPWAVEWALQAGFESVGESRVQEALEKMEQVAFRDEPVSWELIGHLQRNKTRLAASRFDRIQSVDSANLLERLDRHAEEASKKLRILLQVNAGEDPAKYGVEVAEADRLLELSLEKSHLLVEGLMTIAPLADDPSVAARTFGRLRDLREKLEQEFGVDLPVLSMGMTGDLEEAIREGSTMIRVGSALFGPRPEQP